MAMYIEKCKEASIKLSEAFPNGFTVAQVNAINDAIRATMSVRNHNTMDNALPVLFPKATFKLEAVTRERDGKTFSIQKCTGCELTMDSKFLNP